MSANGYTITDSRRDDRLTQGGNKKATYAVAIVTDRGATGTIEVAEKDWSEKNLKAILADFAAKLDLAFTLSEE